MFKARADVDGSNNRNWPVDDHAENKCFLQLYNNCSLELSPITAPLQQIHLWLYKVNTPYALSHSDINQGDSATALKNIVHCAAACTIHQENVKGNMTNSFKGYFQMHV